MTSGLPSSVHTLIIHNVRVYTSHLLGGLLTASLVPFPSGVRYFALLDDSPHGAHRVGRGVFDTLIATAVNATKLEISPCAVSSLSTSLAPLIGLTELHLIQGRVTPSSALGAAEVLAFVNGPAPLNTMVVSSNIYNKWTGMGKRDVRAAAMVRGVQFSVL